MADFLVPFAGPESTRVAERLIGRFGTLGRLFETPLPRLCEAAGGHDTACAALLGARTLVDAALHEDMAASPVDGSDGRLHQWLRAHIGASPQERVHIVFCDGTRRFIADETTAGGGLRNVVMRVRPMIERALSLGAGGLLLAHNHPSGVCRPSPDDVSATLRIADIAAALEIDLVDHLIVTRRAVFSMKLAGCF